MKDLLDIYVGFLRTNPIITLIVSLCVAGAVTESIVASVVKIIKALKGE